MPVVPNFGGKTLQEAVTLRTQAGFSGGVYTVSADETPPATHKITLQIPSAGVTKPITETMTVYVKASAADLAEEGIIWTT